MQEANRVTAHLKVTAEFYDPEATPETVRACVEQDLEDAGYDVEVSSFGNWISVKDRLPPERDTVFAKLKGTNKWNPNMFAKSSDDVRVAVRFEDGSRTVSHDHTVDGKWHCETERCAYPKCTVTHWMENPKLPEEP